MPLYMGAVAAFARAGEIPAYACLEDRAAPAGIIVAKVGAGQVYADGAGRVLYGMDMRVLQRFPIANSCGTDWFCV